ncbi:MAG: CARDB domain-containing protein [Nanoarchaeota archaeon]
MSNNIPPILDYILDAYVLLGEELIIDANATDANNDTLIYSFDSGEIASPYTFESDTGVFAWTPLTSDLGEHLVVFSVSDGEWNDSQEVLITVHNAPPIVEPIAPIIVPETALIHVNVTASDPENDTLTFNFSQPFDANGEWQTTHDHSGAYNATVSVSDGVSVIVVNFSVTVTNVNQPPELLFIEDKAIAENQTLAFSINATDPDNSNLDPDDNNTLSYSMRNAPEHAVLIGNRFAWNTTYYDQGEYAVEFTVTDGEYHDSQNMTITVNNVPYTDLVIANSDILFSNDTVLKRTPVTITAFFHNPLEIDPDQVLVRFYNGSPSGSNLIGEDLVEIRMRSDFIAQVDWRPEHEGDYQINVWVDPLNSVQEAREDNNLAIKTLHVTTKPDVRIRDQDISFSNNNPRAGQRVTAFAMVRNIESLPTGLFTVRFYYDNWNNLIGERNLTLDPFNTKIVNATWTAVQGTHTIYAYADSRYRVDELNETNNRGMKNITVQGGTSSPLFVKPGIQIAQME